MGVAWCKSTLALMSKRATYTTIVHDTLRKSGLSVQEFFIADVVDKLSNPWCYMLRDNLSEMVGITRQGLLKVLKRLETEGYIERSPKGLRSTERWKLMANVDDGNKVSVPPARETKFPSNGNKVSVDDGNKVSASIYISNDNNKDNSSVQEEDPKLKLPLPFGKTPGVRLATVYSLLWWEAFSTLYKPDYGAFTKAMQPLLESYNEWQVAALLCMHFDWFGLNGDDEFANKSLTDKGFPIYWVATKQNEYMTYLTNVLEVKWEDRDSVRDYVKQNIKVGFMEYSKRGLIKIPDVITK